MSKDLISLERHIGYSRGYAFKHLQYRIAGNFHKNKILEKVAAVKFGKLIFGNKLTICL